MKKNKINVLITFSEDGKNGGPYVSHQRIIESSLKDKYNFIPFFIPRTRKVLNPFVFLKMVKEIKKMEVDIFHCDGLQLSGFLKALLGRVSKVDRIIVAVHGSTSEAIKIMPIVKKNIIILESLTLNLCSSFYGVSNYVLGIDHIDKYKKKSMGIIHNLPNIMVEAANENVRIELGLKKDDIVIVSTGRITKEKGFDILSEVIRKMNYNSRVKFLIVGEGEYLNQMREDLSSEVSRGAVIFTGYRSDVPHLLAASDVFILLTLHETLSNSTLEAGMQGLPAVVSNVGGLPEIIHHGVNGYLVDTENIDFIIQALNNLIHDKRLRIEMGNNAKRNITHNFSREKIIQQIDQMYLDVLRKNF